MPPSSVEEAAAELGAAITRLGVVNNSQSSSSNETFNYVSSSSSSPSGMHSSFSTHSIPAMELFIKLKALLTQLQSHHDAHIRYWEKNKTSSSNSRNEKNDCDKPEPLTAAPSILAVLMKLLTLSSSTLPTMTMTMGLSMRRSHSANTLNLSSHSDSSSKSNPAANNLKNATSTANVSSGSNIHTTPMYSSALRNVWVKCVVFCLTMGDSLSGRSRIDIYSFLRKMMDLANTNPKSAKAAGGTRIAALQVISSLLESPALAHKLSPWAIEILQICLFGIRSGGSNDPSHRLYAMKLASSVVYACRISTNDTKIRQSILFVDAIEEKAMLEILKLLKRASEDKFPEIREQAAVLAGLVANVAIYIQQERKQSSISNQGIGLNRGLEGGGNGTSAAGGVKNSNHGGNGLNTPFLYLEDVVQLILKNFDDENVGVAAKWAEALARCLCVTIAYGKECKETSLNERNINRRVEGDDDNDAGDGNGTLKTDFGVTSSSNSSDLISKLKNYSENRKAYQACTACSSLLSTMQFLGEIFIKSGGENASKCGGNYSAGGRSVRTNISLALSHLLRILLERGDIGQDGVPVKIVLESILRMLGKNFEKQLLSVSSNLFVGAKKAISSSSTHSKISIKAKAMNDAGLARFCVRQILRSSLGELSSESTQLSILRELALFCNIKKKEKQLNCPNAHQLQVALAEISHLVTVLGEASPSALDEILPSLRACISHRDRGVRYEVCNVFASLTYSIPHQSKELLLECLQEVELQRKAVSEIKENVTQPDTKNVDASISKRRFRRTTQHNTTGSPETTSQTENMLRTLHGNTLAVSMILLQMPLLPNGLEIGLLDQILNTAECLVSSMNDEDFIKKNPSAASSCTRAGYFMISSALTIGPHAILNHVELLFHLWDQSTNAISSPNTSMNKFQQLNCLEAFLSSVVVFLRSCSNFLLDVPYALNRSTIILEKVLEAVSTGGAFSNKPKSDSGIFLWKNVQSLTMEAFCWLPPGSFPLAVEKLFSFTIEQIKLSTALEVSTSILPMLISSEDSVLDITSLSRATLGGHAMGSSISDSFAALSCNPASPAEKESILHTEAWRRLRNLGSNKNNRIAGSSILGLFDMNNENPPPTPLHSIGTWKEPIFPNLSIDVRLIDSAIQALAASYASQENKEKEKLATLFEMMLLSSTQQGSRVFNVSNALLSETDKNSIKTKLEISAACNTCSALLACIKSLPFYEEYIDDQIRMGSPWMTKTTNVLFTLIPSTIHLVRRAAAEGLASLAAVGLNENKHSVQSSILHSLDEIMQGNNPDGTVKKVQPEMLISSRAGALLTLACIQRTIYSLFVDAKKRAELRSHAVDASSLSSPPTMIMMTRVLACLSTSTYAGDSMMIRASALHVFGLLLSYSFSPDSKEPGPEHIQILRKAVELIEHNFLSTWTTTSLPLEKSLKTEKFEIESILLTVLIRLITSILPKIHLITDLDPFVTGRLSAIVSTILDFGTYHPATIVEGLAFFEVASTQENFQTKENLFHENLFDSCSSHLTLRPNRPTHLPEIGITPSNRFNESFSHYKVTMRCLQAMLPFSESSTNENQNPFYVSLFQLLEACAGSRHFFGASISSTIALGRDYITCEFDSLEWDITSTINACMMLDIVFDGVIDQKKLLHWLLFSRSIASGNVSKQTMQSFDASVFESNLNRDTIENVARITAQHKALEVVEQHGSNRWQVKVQAMTIANSCLSLIIKECMKDDGDLNKCPHFCPIIARDICSKTCRNMNSSNNSYTLKEIPRSFVALHLEELLTTACVTSVATLDHTELSSLQNVGMELLVSLMNSFGEAMDPDDSSALVLAQFSSQIVSSIKHGIELSGEDGKDVSNLSCADYALFLSGSKAIPVIAKKGFAKDPLLIRRLIQPLISPEIDITHFPTNAKDVKNMNLRPSPFSCNERHVLTHSLGSLSAISNLWFSSSIGILSGAIGEVMVSELKKSEQFCAMRSGILSLDAVRMIQNDNEIAGKGKPMTNPYNNKDIDEKPTIDDKDVGGIMFTNLEDLDDIFKTSLTKVWPTLASFSVFSFSNLYNRQEESERAQCILEWLEILVPLLFKAVRTSLNSFYMKLLGAGDKLSQQKLEELTFGIHSLRTLMTKVPSFGTNLRGYQEEISDLLLLVSEKCFLPILGVQNESIVLNSIEMKKNNDIINFMISEICELIEITCKVHKQNESLFNKDILIKVVFTPLNAWQSGRISTNIDRDMMHKIMIACLQSACSLVIPVECDKKSDDFLQATINLTTSILNFKNVHNKMLRGTAKKLLKDCIKSPSLSLPMMQSIVRQVALQGNWDAWATFCANMESDSGISCCVDVMKQSLQDFNNIDGQVWALEGLKTCLQEKDSLLIPLVRYVGPVVINLFRVYGSSSNSVDMKKKTIICADALRITMQSIQGLNRTDQGDGLIVMLDLVFTVMVELLEFNGLPSKPSGNQMSDPAIGKMCAQALLHSVKSFPNPSKSVISRMESGKRAILESAVRAEMIGNQVQNNGPTKKKLSLKKFTKVHG